MSNTAVTSIDFDTNSDTNTKCRKAKTVSNLFITPVRISVGW